MTQYERITGCSVEELANIIDNYEDELIVPPCKCCEYNQPDGICTHVGKAECHEATLNWLKSEVE